MTSVAPFPPAPDWSAGTYEATAEQLWPAAAVLVGRAAPAPGETVLDIGCGTGSVTLLSALRGAYATGVDPARRLLEVGRDEAMRQGLEARFLCGDAAALPVGDGAADVVLSSFGLIFADDPVAAAAEIARVRAPRGRVVFTAWAPGNPLDRAFEAMIGALTRALAEHGIAAPARFAWHDTEALTTLFAPLGLSPRLEHHELAMTGESVRAYFDECIATHPLWVSAAALLAEIGEFQAVHDTIIETLAHANEDPSAFQITSRYVVVRVDAVPAAQQLRDALGDLISLPGEPAYETGRQAWNLAVDQRPAAVAVPADADDVRRLVLAAGRAGLRVAPQSTGHGARDGVILHDAVLLRTDRLDQVLVDADQRRARVGAGARWGAVSDAAEPHRLAALAGSSRDVGVAGYTLGGGIGWLARRHGLACNAVVSIELVTTDGRLLRTDATNEPELFWALRGGGGDLGVVTEFELELFDVPALTAGALFWPLEQAGPVLQAWAEWTRDLPDELTSLGRLLRVPPAPEIPEPLRGRAFAVIELAFLGARKAADTLLAGLRELNPALDTVEEVSPAALGWLHMDPEGPVPAADDGVLLETLTGETIDALLAAAGAHVDSPLLSVEIRHLAGATGRSAAGAGATAFIPAPYAVFAVGPTADEATDASVKTHLRRVRTALEPWSSTAGYLHFTTDRTTCFTPDAAARLTDVKAQWDAGSLITSNDPREP